MIFGFNTEVKIGSTVYHVQTEDHGGSRHLIETTVYMAGRLIHRRKTSYEELLASPNFSDAALRQQLEEQHKGVIDELREGSLTFEPGGKPTVSTGTISALKPAAAATAKAVAAPVANPAPAARAAAAPTIISAPAKAVAAGAQMQDPGTWYAAGTATLKIDVKAKATNQPLADAMLLVVIQSPQGPITFAAKSDSKGRVELVFPLPRMGTGGAELIIKVPGEDEIKYSLKPTTT